MTAKFSEKAKRCKEAKDCIGQCSPVEITFCINGFCDCELKQELEVDYVTAKIEKNEKGL